MAKRNYRDKVIIKQRMLFVLGILLLLFFGLIGRLTYIMVAKSPEYKSKAIAQWTSDVSIAAKRGRILDRNLNELAVSGNVYRIDLDLNALRNTMSQKKITNDEVSQKIADALGMNKADVLKIVTKKLSSGLPMAFATLKRRVEKNEADKASNLKLNGVIVSPDTKRYYPNNNFLAQVLGHTNSDGKGLTGVELEYDKELSGTPGKRIAEIDKKNNDELPYSISEYKQPQNGEDVVLTIDEVMQSFAEKAAQQALSDNKAKAATVIVMNPQNGEVLAMANKPDYNPNNPWQDGKSYDELQKMWRNRAVSDAFEPGSIFKIVTATAAMEEGVVNENSQFMCNGSLTVGGRQIHCWKTSGHGPESFLDILKNSCNVGFMQVGQKLGKEKLCKYIQLFGFGQKTGIDLNGEASGIVKKASAMNDVDLATMSFGQVNTITPIQYMAALNAIANGGTWIRPHVMKQVSHFDESNNKEITDRQYDNYGKKKILDANTMKTLRGYLEKVVSEGGGSKAFIEGYHIAGKTGTAQKVVNGVYGSGKYIASFGGMAPANNPQITVFVSIDEPDPSNYYAGQIATPVAKGLFNDIFNYLSLKPDAGQNVLKDVVIPDVIGMNKAEAIQTLKNQNLNYQIDDKGDYITNIVPVPGYVVKEGSKVVLYTGTTSNYNKVVIVPNLVGYSKKDAEQALLNLGLKAEFTGEGIVTKQDAEPGHQINKGATVNITLENVGD